MDSSISALMLLAVKMLSPIYIGGSNGQVRRFYKGNWSKTVDCETYTVTALHQLPNGAVIAGCSNGKILRLDWGGTSWVEIFDGTGASESIVGILSTSSGVIWAYNTPSAGDGKILKGSSSSMSVWNSLYWSVLGIDPSNDAQVIMSGEDGIYSGQKIHYSSSNSPFWSEDGSHPFINTNARASMGWDPIAGEFVHLYSSNYLSNLKFSTGNIGNWTDVYTMTGVTSGPIDKGPLCVTSVGDIYHVFYRSGSGYYLISRISGVWSTTFLVFSGTPVSQGAFTNGYAYFPIPATATGQVLKVSSTGSFSFEAIGLGTSFYANAASNGGIVDSNPPIIELISPSDGEIDVSISSDISLNITDELSGVEENLVEIYIDGNLSYQNGMPQPGFSTILTQITDGYNYIISPDNNLFSQKNIVVHVIASDYSGNIEDEISYFTTESFPMVQVNNIYFSDAYGLKKIDISKVAGESQTQAQLILSTITSPSIPENTIDSIHGEKILDLPDNFYLSFSLKNSNGFYVLRNEIDLIHYCDGYKMYQPQINDRGILYVINKFYNHIEVYYGIHYSFSNKAPDFIYSSTSTPPIISGDIQCLVIKNNASTEMGFGTKILVGTSLGMTRIEAFDAENPDGVCSGLDNLGASFSYSIPSLASDYPVLGGSVPGVNDIAADVDKMVMFVSTNDGSSNGGLTQISLVSNKKTVFMSAGNGLLPSSVVRNISKKIF